ncbi:MAG: hypothetical protein IJF32_05860 [Oscillospiraceae bacterium]|nr:hypothetical protein [Oscillospiraceae bacterium]
MSRPGRPAQPKLPIWAVDPFDAKNSSTCAVISMCIKEDYKQTLRELAERLAVCKDRPVNECMAVLRELKKKGHLGYFVYRDGFYFRRWEPGRKRKGNKHENVCNAILRT